MTTVLLNFIEFDQHPFVTGIDLYCYKPKDDIEFKELGRFVRILRVDNRNNPIFHYNRNIHSLFKIEYTNLDFNNKFEESEPFSLKIENFKDPIIKRLSEFVIGNVIINNILRDASTIWRISESPNLMVYEIQKYDGDYSIRSIKQKIAIYQAYTIRPKIILPNRIGFYIDCKSKIFYNNSLADRNLLEMMKKSEDHNLIDICPNFNCPQMKKAFSTCLWTTPNSGRKFVRENPFSSADTKFEIKKEDDENFDADINVLDDDEEIYEEDDWNQKFPDLCEEKSLHEEKTQYVTLKEYHNDISTCPENLILKSFNLSLNSIKVSIHERFYDYPPERLRPTVSTKRLNREDKSFLMNRFIIPPHFRLRKIEKFVNELCQIIKFEKENLSYIFKSSDPIRYQLKKPSGKIIQNNQYDLKLSNSSTLIPAMDLEKYNTYDFDRRKESVKLLAIYFGEISDEDYNRLFNFNLGAELKTFFKFKNVEIENLNPEIKENRKFEQYKSLLKNYDCFLIFHGKYEKLSGENQKILNELFSLKKGVQGINVSNYLNKIELSEYNYFRNILLGIYAKCKFLPWVINKEEITSEKFIGLNIKSSRIKNEKYVCISIYKSNGVLEQIYYKKCTLESFLNDFRTLFQKIIKNIHSKKHKTKYYCLILGNLFEDQEKIIKECIAEQDDNYAIFEIFKNSNVRFFEEMNGRIKQVKIGTSFISPTENEAFFTSIEPFAGTANPIKIKYHPLDNNDYILDSDIQKLFDLTQSYIGYVNFRIKLPIPVYAVQQTLNELRKLDLNEYDSDIPVFI